MSILNRPSKSPAGSIIENLVAAAVIVFLLAIMGFDANREQEAWNNGAMLVILGATAVYTLLSLLILRIRKPSRGDLIFIHYGGGILILLAFLAYHVCASIGAGRTL